MIRYFNHEFTTLIEPTGGDSNVSKSIRNTAFFTFSVLALIIVSLMWYWSDEPDIPKQPPHTVIGTATTQTTIDIIEALLNKPGGYLRNDKLPPGLFMDNIPNWEYGVLKQVRDMTRSLRNDFSRSQSQSKEDADLAAAEGHLIIGDKEWIFPAAEDEYNDGAKRLKKYLARLSDPKTPNAQFYARADNLNAWLGLVEKRLGDTSQSLSASIANVRENTDLDGDDSAVKSTSTGTKVLAMTPWLEIDDIFYEARGTAWALTQLLKAIEVDFQQVLEKKNATASLKQIIRELEAAQQPVSSPVILNGSGFGFFANHSLVMASYISRANAAIIDLRQLLTNG